MDNFCNNIYRSNITILEALKALNEIKDGPLTLYAVDENSVLQGTLTDGDLRRALIKGYLQSDSINNVINKNFHYLNEDNLYDIQYIKFLKNIGIKTVPFIDRDKRIINIFDLNKIKSILPIDAIIMAGGKGERLRPLTEHLPKPLIKIGDKAIIDYSVDSLLSYGIKNINVTVNYLKELIEAHLKEEYDNHNIKCIPEPFYLGTLGSVKLIPSFINDTILVMNSDVFTNLNFEDFYLDFIKSNADVAVATVPYSFSIPYGVFQIEGELIKDIFEKPIYDFYTNAGIYLFKKELVKYIPDLTFFNATDFLKLLISKNFKIIKSPITGYWIDIGKHEDLNKARDLVKHV